ncbi:transformation/transcription domain-associated protein-like [Uloborus diversus]|uniref:transformation/transcription domain-associated protein-like n=1 Tax=Uloborus diversus TaxID=327109 RepID=UPI00240A01D7|nr:transformation/transcription domain-associated protein-like [Uloborus diversus]
MQTDSAMTLMNAYRSYVSMLVDPAAKEDSKLKVLQELGNELEAIVVNSQYPSFLEHALRIFLKILQDGDPYFLSEHTTQQLRKLILEILHRLPTNNILMPHSKSILSLMFKLLETENEENVLVVLRIIIEFHKTYRPPFSSEISQFLAYVKRIYKDLPNQLNKIFDPRPAPKVKDVSQATLEPILNETFTGTVLYCERRGPDGSTAQYNLIPKASLSLKVLAELPIIVVLMYQLYKNNVHKEVEEFIPLIIVTLTLQPTAAQRNNPNFNKEIFVDFMAAQIKTLSFLAYIVRIYQTLVMEHSTELSKGVIGLLSLCPPEVAHLRKELLIAARHILATELRDKFVNSLEELFDENILIGPGWTAHESLRPLAYSTLADLVHHVRQHLPFKDLTRAVNLFSKNVHDESLLTTIQTMSCKLLLNLVECIKLQAERENKNGRELLMRMMEVLVLKFKTIAKLQIPVLIMKAAKQQQHQQQQQVLVANALHLTAAQSATVQHPAVSPAVPINISHPGLVEVKTEPKDGAEQKVTFQTGGLLDNKEEKTKFGFPASHAAAYSIADCRSLVKTLVCGVKTVTWGVTACKVPSENAQAIPNNQFQPKETLVYIRLIKYALQALDIYALSPPIPGQVAQRTMPVQSVRSKEEKEVLEHLAGVYTMMHPLTFREVFSTTIDFVVDRISKNVALQILANSFLANTNTSPIFATILVEYLLKRMEEMGSNMERSNLYLKLFKLVFGSVSLFPAENEQMLKPYLHQIVNRSMELALSAKEPYNYFLLLRALFRSIGGGSHDLLYQEFLPLLPNLLQGLNSLQSGLHKQHMKDLFVELCLTVPVRLSSLLPYLPMLMDPLVSALNGSQTLVSQGLRTLELCVDNLQPDFLYDHIQPVRAELMQALWRTLRNPTDQTAQVAFRVLGKFGGGNRKMMVEPQRLEYNSRESIGPCISIYFQEQKTNVSLPIGKVIETAFNALKTSTTDAFYRRQCWEVIQGFLAANIEQDDEKHNVHQLFLHPSFTTGVIPPQQGPYYLCPDAESRKIHEMALTGMFVAAAIKELRPVVVPFMIALVRHYTFVAISQQAGPFVSSQRQVKPQGMDPLVLVDATAAVMGHEEKELCKPGNLAMVICIETAQTILHSKQRACSLPIIEYLAEKMCALCYDRAWYAKLGGCFAIKTLLEKCHPRWIYSHMYSFLKALLFVMMDLTGEVSSGAVDMAKNNLELMLKNYCKPCKTNDLTLVEVQKKAISELVQELVRQLTQPNNCVREQAMHSLKVIAEVGNTTITQIIEPHKDLLADYVPLRKHILRHQPVLCQIGLLDGNTFCITLEPRLFSYDLNIADHKQFFDELMMLSEHDDAALLKLPCYKSLTNLIPIRKAMLRLLSACCYMPDKRNDIFQLLYKALSSNVPELQEVGYLCIKDIISKYEIDIDMVHTTIRPLLLKLGDYRSLSIPVIQHLSYLTLLFRKIFNDKLCDQLLTHLNKCLEVAEATVKSSDWKTAVATEVKICSGIIDIFHQIPAASTKFIEPLLTVVLKTEKNLLMEAGSHYRGPLVKFLKRYPSQTVEYLLSEQNLKDAQLTRFLEYLLKGDRGKLFREVLQQKHTSKLVSMTLGVNQSATALGASATANFAIQEIQYQAIRIVSLLVKYDDQWLSEQHQLVACLRKIWISKEFQERHLKADSVDYSQWKEPKLLAKCLLNFVKHHPNEIELLFQLLRAFTGRFIHDFEFLRDFLENTVANNYTVDWKRMAFFKFVELFCDANFPQDLKAKILQYILIPSFAIAFEKGEGERLIGGPPAPEQDLNENVMSVFINKIIDSESPVTTSDAVRILLLQFSCLLVEQASPHIHDAANKRQGNKLRRLMTFAWPCLLTKNCVDPATKYHGHLLLANIIAKFAIHKRIVLQVFHSLLKAHAAEARSVVRQALEILTPAMPVRMEDGNNMLTHWTKKIIVEEGHILAQLVHMLQLVVRHYKVYFPVRHHLVRHMVNSIQRLAFSPNGTMEHKRLAVDLAEVIIRWEITRQKEEQEKLHSGIDKNESSEAMQANIMALKQRSVADGTDNKRLKNLIGTVGKHADRNKPIEKEHADAVVNFLLRMACQVNESSTAVGTTGEILSRRCVALLKTALKPDVWPNAELKLTWFDKLLSTIKENPQPNYGNICTALELLAFLLSILRKEIVLTTFRPLQRGIASCLNCNNSKVIRSVHNLLSRLMSLFPTEPTNSSVASKYEELECLYAVVSNVVLEGLNTYEKSTTSSSPQPLFATLMILKSACVNNPCYIDRLISSFMRVLQKMTKEHLATQPEHLNPMATDLLILSLDLVKNRVGVMGQDMRKTFIGSILVGLLEKSPDVKILKAITKMVEDWVKSKSTIAVNQSPSIREKSILLVKMMQFIEKRFPNELDLNAQFLELVHYVYKDESLKSTELQSKLEPAFMAGLRCVQPHIRAKFFELFDNSMRRRLHDRMLYIICAQNWETIGSHFWIKQCIELLLVTAVDGIPIQTSTPNVLLPAITAVIEQADSQERATYAMSASIKEEPMDVESVENKEEEIDIELPSAEDGQLKSTIDGTLSSVSSHQLLESRLSAQTMLAKQAKFHEALREVKTMAFLNATAQLCHMDTTLAQHLFIQLFPRLWKILSDKQQTAISSDIVPFIVSGSHNIQKDCHPSAAGTLVEAISHCTPSIPMKPTLLQFLGKNHNQWHRATLLLEQICFDKGIGVQVKSRIPSDLGDPDSSQNLQLDALDYIAEMYSSLKEEDLWGGLWQKRSKFPETGVAVALEQQGLFMQALSAYERVIGKSLQEYGGSTPISLTSEQNLWYKHWIRCLRELNMWENLLQIGMSPNQQIVDPYLALEFAWRQPNWPVMKEALEFVEQNCPRELTWKVQLYKGYLVICNPEDRAFNMIERIVELCTNICIREWRRLPHIVSHVHLPILQATQQIMELQDAVQIHQGLMPANIGRVPSLHDMKAIVKTWRNRLPVISDDLSHWSEIFYWRQEHYKTIVSSYEPIQNGQQIEAQANHAMLGVHASAQSIIHYGKIARKHGLTSVCQEALGRIHSIPSVPIVDCFQKIRQQVKCFLQMAHVSGKNDLQETTYALHEGLNVIESTNLKYFTKEMTAEFHALKGVFLAQMGRSEDANKAFSAGCQLHDTLVKAWALWGDYTEHMFTKEKPENRNMMLGVTALTCFLHSCRHQNESKARKYLAKILWLLTYDDETLQLTEAVDKYSPGVPPLQWLPWVPQLLTCLVRNEGQKMLNIISQVGRAYPQAVYFPIRTLYLILKIEQREKYKSGNAQALIQAGNATLTQSSPAVSLSETSGTDFSAATAQPSESAPIRATQPMWRCSRIMHMQRDIHPTILLCLEGIVDQMVWFRENVYEEVLRQLRQALAKCYAVAYETAGAVSDSTVTPHTLNFVKKLVSTFGIGVENISTTVSTAMSSSVSESLARRAQATAQDPVFQKMKGQFTADFDFSVPGAMKLHNLIMKLKKWVKILEGKTKLLHKSFLIEEKCRFLNNFAQQTADVEIPGEFLLPRHNHYFVRISRFMPRVDIVQKHNTAARRLYIKGHNGKIYPYLVVNDACLSDARREERVLQLLRMLNHYLGKQKETSKRFLNFTVPRIVPVSPQLRLVEDNESSISLLDIYKQRCAKRGIEYDAPLQRFYERLATVQARGSQASHQVLRDILKDVQSIMVSKSLLKDWAEQTYPVATDYWTFRKQFTLQLALAGFVEYVLHLTRLNPDMMYIHQDSGLMNISYFRFNVDDANGELDATRPVPFRLTPNISEFITTIGICGPMTASMVAVARCLAIPNFKVASLLRAILRDEMIAWYKKRQDDSQVNDSKPDADGAVIIQMVTKAVTSIMARLQSLATFEGSDSKVSTLVAAANSHDNLCRMDPAWHPWL